MDNHEDECRVAGEPQAKQEDEEAVARLVEMKKSIEAKVSLRQSNLNPERPDSGFLRTLDSSIKRNTAVIKKLKQINEEQREGLMDELRNVNLSKFVSEAVTAICDAKLRTSDIQAAVQICSLLHQRYKDFSPSLVQGLLKVFFPGKSGEDMDVDRNSKAMKKRSTLKLLLELYFVGVIEDSSIFINIIKDLTSVEHLKDRDATQTNLTLLASFARQGRVFLGLTLSGQEIHEEFFKGFNITADQKKIFRKSFNTYFDAVSELLRSEHTSLSQMEHENTKILNAKGELSDENVASYEKLRKSYDHLYRHVSSLAEALDMPPPEMPEDGHTTRVTTGEDSPSAAVGKDSSVLEALWDDEDTRAFYECLPDLRAFVPAVLLGEAEPKVNEQSAKSQEQQSDVAPESDQGRPTQDTADSSADSGTFQEGKSIEKGKDKEDKDKEKAKDPEKEKGKERDAERKGEIEKEKLKGLEGTNLDALLQRLPGCVSRDLIDQLTVEFCYLNSKSNRKKLVKALFNVPRTSLELLPYYSRMVATLSTCMKDVCSILVQMLEEEFNFLLNKKDQMNIETKIRNIRFIGELCKFRIAPAGLVFNCLKACLDDFTHHNIDVACNLLETCGRFLYRSPETTVRMANMLEILMRLKNVKNLDPRHSTLVENAYYLCKPPERSARVSKVRPPLFQQDAPDPPEDCFRIRMVITLLETCGHYFDRGSSKRKLDRFLIHFQRYILSKGALPLDIEFDLQDLFAELRPSMMRYSSIDEVNAAFIELEENEQIGSTDKVNSEKFSDTEKPSSRNAANAISANGQNLVNGNEENGGIHEDIGESDTDSGSGTLDQEGHDEEELDEENRDDGCETEEEDDDDGGGPVSDEDDEVHFRQKVAEVDPLEAEIFEQELKAVLQESMEQRRQELRGRPTLNMVIPMSLFEGSTKDYGRAVGGESGDEALDDETGGSKEVQVKVLVKRGNKQQTKQMYIPRDCTLVQSTKQKEAAEFEEKQDIKRLVLEYNDREEEENNGLGTQTLNWMLSSSNRVGSRGSTWEGSSGRGAGSRHRHQHQHQHQHQSGSGVYHGRRR
ncbi:regulator of nonsense transcripts UPF2-like [Hevea brasiliensis]|uniref:regulator of nonsense transcripts UPF2-like n=1 Tax=Hevea brasiliensis TaxID=3981 RepID=UPI0025D0B18B|nr:regulator of nonsense transcripts UPF2-like [Hevea brasiliensis]